MVADTTKVRVWIKETNLMIEYTFNSYEDAMQFLTTTKDHQTASTLPIQYQIVEEF